MLIKLVNAAEVEEEKLSDTMHDIKYGLRSTNKYNDYTIGEIKQVFKAYEHIRMYRFKQAYNIVEEYGKLFSYPLWNKLNNLALAKLTDAMCKEILQSNRLNSNSPNKKKN